MDLQELKNYCLNKKGVYEDFPFDDETLVLKVGSKMFALTNINEKDLKVNLKCDPIMSQDLRREYNAIKPGYHMNKTHWNTVKINGSIDDKTIKMLIDISYDLVFKGLKKKEREEILK
ncbi:MmcQ/YjbR family DNA-binding protein [Clostridium aciditolerans]|uniref:MmcQ/YjbR family DNA-binding protein n=1 Tax=Clostridium aciditolerans TaxID=339861 RepID=A0A934HXP1_9CLOT|nr:MmcQ/YjbR family DNA-binding protein [Clostridium aciditolerans]MBI6872477.1 MmcQ/YjbR family DNA-binding protein [Clostridium aciditolerans]